MGGASVTTRIKHRPLIASDKNQYVVALWQAVQAGWVPPTEVDEKEYHRVKANQDENQALTAFVGVGCSFGAKWWGGYARPNSSNPFGYAGHAHRSCLKKVLGLAGIVINHNNYDEIRPLPGDLVYCDPPYFNTVNGYKASGFDVNQFWSWCRDLATNGITVLVSEVSAPPDIRVLDSFNVKRAMRSAEKSADNASEFLYIVDP